jgi:Bacterial RNA polymerase, alpha chain C terminal domain
MDQNQGLIAVLDALGASTYSDREISKFLASRERVLRLLRGRANANDQVRGSIQQNRVSTFTFNDTVLLTYRTKSAATLQDVEDFCRLLRKFVVDSLVEGILFRGSLALGSFYVDESSNTVMGPAVTDAAAWYESADWLGVMATPHATLGVQALADGKYDPVDHVLIDYAVPLKGNSGPVAVKAVNWPKALFDIRLTPLPDTERPRAGCLSLLTRHQFPKGTEQKYLNTVAFFDHCHRLWMSALGRKIEALGLSERSGQHLKELGIASIEDLVQLVESYLLKKGVSLKSLYEIKEVLAAQGLTLGMKPQD